ncbi:hypothetical protein VTK26DRAFT_1495 [Humicola hyalothermophila]
MMGPSNRGAMMDRVLTLVPVICSLISFTFLAVALSSGTTEGYLENLNIVNLNTSRLGQNIIEKPDISGKAAAACGKLGDNVDEVVGKGKDIVQDVGKTLGDVFGRSPEPEPAVGDELEKVCNKGAEIVDKLAQIPIDAVNNALGSVAKAMGIKEYYSLHIGVLCEGSWKPSFNSSNAKADVQSCSTKFAVSQLKLLEKISNAINKGPLDVTLSAIGLDDAINAALKLIPTALAAMSIFYLVALVALLLGFLVTAATAVLESGVTPGSGSEFVQKALLNCSLGLLGLGWLLSFIGAVSVTAIGHQIRDAVNEHADKFGMSASTPPGMYFLLWLSLLFATVAIAVLALVKFVNERLDGLHKRGQNFAKDARSVSSVDNRGFYQEPVAGGGGYPGMANKEYQ